MKKTYREYGTCLICCSKPCQCKKTTPQVPVEDWEGKLHLYHPKHLGEAGGYCPHCASIDNAEKIISQLLQKSREEAHERGIHDAPVHQYEKQIESAIRHTREEVIEKIEGIDTKSFASWENSVRETVKTDLLKKISNEKD